MTYICSTFWSSHNYHLLNLIIPQKMMADTFLCLPSLYHFTFVTKRCFFASTKSQKMLCRHCGASVNFYRCFIIPQILSSSPGISIPCGHTLAHLPHRIHLSASFFSYSLFKFSFDHENASLL